LTPNLRVSAFKRIKKELIKMAEEVIITKEGLEELEKRLEYLKVVTTNIALTKL